MPEVTSHAPGTPSWFELVTTDAKGALDFYGALFSWVDDPQQISETDFYHMQKLNGLESAAIYQQPQEERDLGIPPHWNTYFTVASVDEVVAKVEQAKGSLLFGPQGVIVVWPHGCFHRRPNGHAARPPGRGIRRVAAPGSHRGPGQRRAGAP